jgi:hypothetical protein
MLQLAKTEEAVVKEGKGSTTTKGWIIEADGFRLHTRDEFASLV